MMRAPSASLMSAFDGFLFASVGEENGMRLSMLSLLARLDLDPWHEAEQLAHSTEAMAARRLSALIAALPNGPKVDKDPDEIAADLIVLLPRRVSRTSCRNESSGKVDGSVKLRALLYAALLNTLFMALAICSQYVGESRQSHLAATIAPVAAANRISPTSVLQVGGR